MYFKQLYTWQGLLPYIALVITTLALLTSFNTSAAPTNYSRNHWHHAEQAIMGTRIAIDIEHSDAFKANQVIDEVFSLMWDINNEMSNFKADSTLSLVNQEASIRPIKISDRLFFLIQKSLYYSKISDGAFDITVGTIGQHYNYRKNIKPTDKLIESNLKHINYNAIKLDKINRTIMFTDAKTRLDLGGIAKGYAIALGINIIKQHGIKNAYLSAGGDSYAIGTRDKRPWLIAIKDPRNGDNKITIPVSNLALSTSGDYERYFIEDEQRYHHILNPSTGRSARKSVSVTVLGESATDTDALSTTLFVLGEKKGLELINSIKGYDAIYVYPDGKTVFSEGLKMRADSK